MRKSWLRDALPILLGALASSAVTTAGHAGWGSTTTLGTTQLVSDPACASDAPGKAVCAALGPASTLYVNRYNGTSWSGWSSRGIVGNAAPTCTGLGTGKAICAVRTTTLQMTAIQWNGTTWSSAVTVGGALESGPSCALLTSGRAICAGRAATGGIASSLYSGASWSTAAWSTLAVLADATYSAPDCTSDAAGHAFCGYLLGASDVAVREFDGTKWIGPVDLGPRATTPPRCTEAGTGGKVGCFANGTDSGLYANLFAGGSFNIAGWSGFRGLGGLVHGFDCSQSGQKAAQVRYSCAVTALVDNALYTNDYNGTSWTGYTSRGGKYQGWPSCFPLDRTTTPGKIMCVVRTQANTASSIRGP